MFWKWPISIIGKMLNIGQADNRSTPSSDLTLESHAKFSLAPFPLPRVKYGDQMAQEWLSNLRN